MSKNTRQRRMISTYPFKYFRSESNSFFIPDKAAIYIHIPFCLKKCDYCTYVSETNSTESFREKYVDTLCKEISTFSSLDCYPKFLIDAIYFGGGTPSLLKSEQIGKILKTCSNNFNFVNDLELCIEIDPKTATEKKLSEYLEFGFNRISFGVQDFNDSVLKYCNRSHNAMEASKAIEMAKKAGHSNFNIDLIYPLHNQSRQNIIDSLEIAISHNPATITAHVLEVWSETRYSQIIKEREYQLPSFDEEIELTHLVYDTLENHGFNRWSTCGYYNPKIVDHYCRFMDYYWKTYPMIGFGVSAKSVLGNRVYTNTFSTTDYINKISNNTNPLDLTALMTKKQEMLRVIIRGLKACVISKKYFESRFGVPIDIIFSEEINFLVKKGLLNNSESNIELTREGQVHDRAVYSVFYTEEDLREPKQDEVMFGLSMDPSLLT